MWKWFLDGGHVYVGLVMAVLPFLVHFNLIKERSRRLALELLLMYLIGVAGFKGIFGGFVMHFFFADLMAKSIGWPAGNPFQTEVAFFNLAVGVLGAASFWRRDFWVPFLVVTTIMGWGAGFVHILDVISTGNTLGNNAGPILYADIIMPVVRLVIYFLYRKASAE